MPTLVFMILVLFTSAGPAQITHHYDGTLVECNKEATMMSMMAGKQIPGPDGEPANILDAQAQCVSFTQGTTASAH